MLKIATYSELESYSYNYTPGSRAGCNRSAVANIDDPQDWLQLPYSIDLPEVKFTGTSSALPRLRLTYASLEVRQFSRPWTDVINKQNNKYNTRLDIFSSLTVTNNMFHYYSLRTVTNMKRFFEIQGFIWGLMGITWTNLIRMTIMARLKNYRIDDICWWQVVIRTFYVPFI